MTLLTSAIVVENGFKLLFAGLLSKLLLASPKLRITVADLQKDRWFSQGKSRYQNNRYGSDFIVKRLDWGVNLCRCEAAAPGLRKQDSPN